jgi:GNAT superfamily N-acetyltransferase
VFVRKFARNSQDYGLRTAIGKSIAYLLQPIFSHRTYCIYKIKIPSNPPEARKPAKDINFQFLGESDHQYTEQIENMAEWYRGKLRQRLAAGDVCLAALCGNRVVGFNLVTFGETYISLIRLTRRLWPSAAWSDHIAVHKDFRRKGIASQLRSQIFSELHSRGIRTFFGGTLCSNKASLNLAGSLGFRVFVEVTYVKLFTWESWICKRVRSSTNPL